MDDKWRIANCGLCYAGTRWSFGDEGPIECDCSGGVVYLRPKGHAFAWPGGPACGWWSEEKYKKAKPVMPFSWHTWLETEKEIDKMTIDEFGNISKGNIVHCSCGLFVGPIYEHDRHVKEEEEKFIAERIST